MTRAEKAARLGELVLQIAELLAEPEADRPEKPLSKRVVIDDVARQRARRALERHGVKPGGAR